MNNYLLATGQWFYSHGLIGFIILGIIFTLIGYFFGTYLWRRWAIEADQIEEMSTRLTREEKAKRTEISQLETKIKELEAAAA